MADLVWFAAFEDAFPDAAAAFIGGVAVGADMELARMPEGC